MESWDMEAKIIELLQRMERVVTMQECSATNCAKQVRRIEELEDRQENFDIRLAEVQATTAVLHELTQGLQNTYKKLQRLAIGMAILILLSLLLLSVVGFEALPCLLKLAEIIF